MLTWLTIHDSGTTLIHINPRVPLPILQNDAKWIKHTFSYKVLRKFCSEPNNFQYIISDTFFYKKCWKSFAEKLIRGCFFIPVLDPLPKACCRMVIAIMKHGCLACPVDPFTNVVELRSQHWWIITSTIECGMKLHTHSQTSTVWPLKFGNGYVISSHTLQGMCLFIYVGI